MGSQRGLSIVESLVAILVLSFGVLGFLSMQLRTLSETQTSVRRAQAIRLIEDLSERLKISPNAFDNISEFNGDWSIPSEPDKKCNVVDCSGQELAIWDNYQWRQSVKELLPGGEAAIFYASGEKDVTDKRQLGVLVGWRANQASTASDYVSPVDMGSGDSDISCRSGFECHLQYIAVNARCAPYFPGVGTVQFYCPGQ